MVPMHLKHWLYGVYLMNARLGEVCFFSGNVRKMADFYKKLFDINNGSDDNSYQLLIDAPVRITICNDGKIKPNNNQNLSLFFAVDDVDAEYERISHTEGLRLHFTAKPTDGADGSRYMSFYDIDGNQIYFRSGGTSEA